MRDGRALDRLGTAFDVTNRTIDVRRIAPRIRSVADPDTAPLDIALHGRGRFNIPDIAVHLWRWQSWPVTDAPAAVVGGGRYMFSPLGHDMPLFSSPPARDRLQQPDHPGGRPAAHSGGASCADHYGPTGKRPAHRRRRSRRRQQDLRGEPRGPARRLLVRRGRGQDRHRSRARPDPVRPGHHAAAVDCRSATTTGFPRRDRRRPLRPVRLALSISIPLTWTSSSAVVGSPDIPTPGKRGRRLERTAASRPARRASSCCPASRR